MSISPKDLEKGVIINGITYIANEGPGKDYWIVAQTEHIAEKIKMDGYGAYAEAASEVLKSVVSKLKKMGYRIPKDHLCENEQFDSDPPFIFTEFDGPKHDHDFLKDASKAFDSVIRRLGGYDNFLEQTKARIVRDILRKSGATFPEGTDMTKVCNDIMNALNMSWNRAKIMLHGGGRGG